MAATDPPEPVAVDQSKGGRQGPALARILPLVGLPVAFWATLPQWTGPKLNVAAATEVADHTIPAVFVVLASVVGILAGRRAQGPGAVRLMAGMVVVLAGLWMLATHLPLVAQATREEAPWPATIYHTSSALAVFGLGLLWSAVTWAEAGDDSEPAAKSAARFQE